MTKVTQFFLWLLALGYFANESYSNFNQVGITVSIFASISMLIHMLLDYCNNIMKGTK